MDKMAKTKTRYYKKSKYSRKNNFLRKSMRNIRETSSIVLPKIEQGLERIGTFVTDAATKGAPIVKKGLVNTFGALKRTSKYAITGIRKTIKKKTNERY
jgi:hypothetical protein